MPAFKCQKIALQMPKQQKMETTFSCQHPSKVVDYMIFLCVYHLWVGFKSILKFCFFCAVFFLARPNSAIKRHIARVLISLGQQAKLLYF